MLDVVKCSTENGFFLELNGQEFDGKSIMIGPKEEKFVSITWEPKEGGDFREIIRFRWGEHFPEFQVIVFGNAVEPNNSKSTVKRKPIPRMAKVNYFLPFTFSFVYTFEICSLKCVKFD